MPEFVVNADESAEEYLRDTPCRVENWLKERSGSFEEARGADIVVVDSYLAELSFYREISSLARRPVYLDDDLRLDYPDGIVLNGAIGAEKRPYPERKGTKYLLGVEYFPLRQEFLEVPVKRTAPLAESVMVTFGGDDMRDLTPRVLQLLKKEFPGMRKKVVVGNPSRGACMIKDASDDRTDVVNSPSAADMKRIMLDSDIAVSAGGQTLYELARLGVPTVAVCVADNQRGNIKGMRDAGFIEYAGEWCEPDPEGNILKCIKKLMPQEARRRSAKIGRRLVDGKGAARVVSKLLEGV